MVLARVNNVKSGWKSMFMVFTTAASDESQMIVRLAFETIEKIVREHFDFITETEAPSFYRLHEKQDWKLNSMECQSTLGRKISNIIPTSYC